MTVPASMGIADFEGAWGPEGKHQLEDRARDETAEQRLARFQKVCSH